MGMLYSTNRSVPHSKTSLCQNHCDMISKHIRFTHVFMKNSYCCFTQNCLVQNVNRELASLHAAVAIRTTSCCDYAMCWSYHETGNNPETMHYGLVHKQDCSQSGLLSANGLTCTRHAKVSLEMLPPNERLAADSAFKGSLPTVCASVPLQAFLKGKLLPAHITLERLLPSVGYRMLL
jgi:hypothetical protein